MHHHYKKTVENFEDEEKKDEEKKDEEKKMKKKKTKWSDFALFLWYVLCATLIIGCIILIINAIFEAYNILFPEEKKTYNYKNSK